MAAARQEAEEYFKKVAVITPEEASRVIVKGILANKNRVLIGADAYRIDRIQRLFPARASASETHRYTSQSSGGCFVGKTNPQCGRAPGTLKPSLRDGFVGSLGP